MRMPRVGVWVDADTMVAPASGGLRRYSAPDGNSQPLSVPGLSAGAELTLVPRTGPA